MKICIISDSHDNRFLMAAAVADAKARGAEQVLHCGDVVAPTTLRILNQYALPVHVIHGNNQGDTYAMGMLAHDPSNCIHYYGQDAAINLLDKRIFTVHFPHYARALALTGDYDLVCCGHDHRCEVREVENVKGGTTILINPGTVGGVGAEPTYAIGDLETMEFEIRAVPVDMALATNKQPVTSHA